MKTKFNGFLTLLLALVVQISFAQEKTISGTVSDASGGLPGVSVVIKETQKGTETDFDGKYTIKAKSGDVLVFRYLGYKTVEKTIGTTNTISVTLEEDASVLDEVVVTSYGSTAKRATTGSITTVKSEDIENVPTANFAEALQGKSTGLQSISSSGQPGSNSSVRIRGTASVNGNTEPLYIIDGIPVSSNSASDLGAGGLDAGNRDPLSNISSADIESVTILKDASSTSIYGARGANGIILITTKKGKQGKAKFSLSSQVGVSARAVELFEVLNASEYIELQRESQINAGIEPAVAVLNYPDSDDDTDWSEYAYRDWDAVTKNTNFSASGGNENVNYYLSLGHLSQEGIAVGSGLERLSSSLNLQANTSENSRVGMSFSYSKTEQQTALAESAYFASPILATYLFPPTDTPYLSDGTPNPVASVTSGTTFIKDNYYDTEGSVTDRLIGSVDIAVDIWNDFTLKSKFGLDKSFFNYKQYGSSLNDSNPSGGTADRAYQEVYNWTWTNTLTWSKTLNEDHNLNVLLGQEINKEGSDYFEVVVEDFPNGILQNVGSAATVTGHASSTGDSSLKSYFLNGNYNFQQKYYLNATIRRDASSRFGPDNKWGTFWSVGGNWNVSSEDFMKDLTWINSLKIKSSYGKQGNLPSNRYLWQGIFLNDTYNESPASYPSSTAANPELKWESQNSFNVGLEFSLFNNKLSGEVTYFSRETSDLLFPQTLEGSSGYTLRYVNAGGFTNKGAEIELNYDVLNIKDFNWSIGGNITFLKNKVNTLDEGTLGADGLYIREIGETWNTFYLREWAGVDVATGQAMWYDANGNITFNYTEGERVKSGNADPKFYGGVYTNFSYKNWELVANASYQYGNKIYNDTSRITNSDGAFAGFNQSRDQLDRWQKPGDISANPQRISGNSSNSNQASTRWLEDGSFVRLKNVSIGYNFSEAITKNTFLNGGKIYLQGTNLLTITDFNGDPEQSINGTHWFSYPNPKTISLGINLSF
ncbi:SusC/RagA family TonB-linked outer membrane protein [Polaribacter sargassicola]|uniref:SusC/RagA family TonB-linked outer membrane protein n=1 Tax=Polaribacter sargassicola TaxID=2836891 RepID=UPI001F3B9369|nr:TonB-dependent receptor [Polaribacter sp. DS7-9]MCG1035709.1 TonB-dependent receptor [Polaribacter sp. DS7-9]